MNVELRDMKEEEEEEEEERGVKASSNERRASEWKGSCPLPRGAESVRALPKSMNLPLL